MTIASNNDIICNRYEGVSMEKKELLKDYLVSRLISFGKKVDGYDKVFYQTNEDLVAPYLDIDFYNKDVLSVLASGDQVLTSRMLEAKKTDAFDFNRLSLYYFYLRLWSIEYRNELYPKILDGNNQWLRELLKVVIPRNEKEKEALKFYQQHIEDDTNLEKMFFDLYCQPEGRTLYTKPKELEGCLSPDLNFYPIDLFQKFDLNGSYDIVLISNILEWARNKPEKLKIAYENLARIVNKNGVVLCSNLIYRSKAEMDEEKRIFDQSFDFEKTEAGYVYIKKN